MELLEAGHELPDVVAHKVELVYVVLVRRMDGHLRGGQAEDEPAVSHVHAGELEHVAQEGPVGIRLSAVDDRVCSDDHGGLSPRWTTSPAPPSGGPGTFPV